MRSKSHTVAAALFTAEEAAGQLSFFTVGDVPAVRELSTRVALRCGQPGCSRIEHVVVTVDGGPDWRAAGWRQTPDGARCPTHHQAPAEPAQDLLF